MKFILFATLLPPNRRLSFSAPGVTVTGTFVAVTYSLASVAVFSAATWLYVDPSPESAT